MSLNKKSLQWLAHAEPYNTSIAGSFVGLGGWGWEVGGLGTRNCACG